MRLRNIKLFISVSVLILFINIGVFGLLNFKHKTEMPMVNCPYSDNGFSVCVNTLDHINNWYQFLNVPLPIALSVLVMLGIVLYLFSKQSLLNYKQYFYRWKYYFNNKKLHTYLQEIIRWLSLFENSPPVNAF